MKISFELEIEFSDPIVNVAEVAENVRRSLEGEISSGIGITPEGEEAYTTKIVIRSQEFGVETVWKYKY
ncbi:hypothetical protein COO91_02021 [Nostoc flagelliforme CCNUN1]|uniref:Uncharacterized protein n=1 Tax=Nostoc flagelliforme CCNUN1 TaxID=2038116 RepID=A0A2K8SL87_9NOSO|nr:hypothetical protein [Nostoc flagelliforme]AUB36120.1 hypothetical protein COO91_02021 [Nostoc flagelliforme CCNUN1]